MGRIRHAAAVCLFLLIFMCVGVSEASTLTGLGKGEAEVGIGVRFRQDSSGVCIDFGYGASSSLMFQVNGLVYNDTYTANFLASYTMLSFSNSRGRLALLGGVKAEGVGNLQPPVTERLIGLASSFALMRNTIIRASAIFGGENTPIICSLGFSQKVGRLVFLDADYSVTGEAGIARAGVSIRF